MKKSRLFLTVVCAALLSMNGWTQGIDTDAPNFALLDTKGNEYKLSNYRGKVVMLFFFGNGCFHCHDNAPNTQIGIYEHFKDEPNFVAFGIETWDGNNKSVDNFASSTNVEYTLLTQGSEVAKDYKTSYDRIFIIDDKGVIQYISPGYATVEASEEAKAKVEELLPQVVSVREINIAQKSFVYPNPAIQYTTILNPFETNGIVKVEIISVAGNIVKEHEVDFSNSGTYQLDVDDLLKGFYIVKLTNKLNELASTPLIKQDR